MGSSTKGNKALTYPIGLITVDEVILAGHGGGVFDGSYTQSKSAINTYLTIESDFWTMTPAGGYNLFGITYWDVLAFLVNASGKVDDNGVVNSSGLRPTINLKSTVNIVGSGTISDPYKVV